MGTRNRVSVMVGVALLLPALASCQRSESAAVDSRAESAAVAARVGGADGSDRSPVAVRSASPSPSASPRGTARTGLPPKLPAALAADQAVGLAVRAETAPARRTVAAGAHSRVEEVELASPARVAGQRVSRVLRITVTGRFEVRAMDLELLADGQLLGHTLLAPRLGSATALVPDPATVGPGTRITGRYGPAGQEFVLDTLTAGE